MKKKLLFVGFLMILGVLCADAAPANAAEGNGLSFFIEPLLLKGLGGTAYDLAFSQGGGHSGLSRLEFPMAALEGGLTAGLSAKENGKRTWLFAASFAHSTLPWGGRMNDYDWFGLSGYPNLPWSYTYSSDATTSLRASAEVAWTVSHVGPLSIALFATYHYQYASHVEDTYTGWFYRYDPVTKKYDPFFTSYAGSDILEYTLTAHEPGIGLMADLEATSGLSLELRAAFTPVYISDTDDHKLRTKLSTASGWGLGFYTDLRAKYQFPQYYRGFSTYLALDGELIYYSVSTSQTQYWYGTADTNADGSTVPVGTTETGIGHVVTSTQFQVGLSFGFVF